MKLTRPITLLALIAFAAMGCRKTGEFAVPLNASTIPPILLFNGNGTSDGDVTAIEQLLNEQHLHYSLADSTELNDMPDARIRSYKLLIIPGGNYITIGDSLTPTSKSKIRDAVENGVNYLGICAGGIIAGEARQKGINLTGAPLHFYAVVNQGIHKAAVPISGNGTPTLDQYWEDGPEFTGWGEVVGKYPDGTPAVVQGNCKKGWMILSGIHPEAPESWRRGMTFTTPASDDNDYAVTLIRASLNGTRLPHY